jgi:hypothetical protein
VSIAFILIVSSGCLGQFAPLLALLAFALLNLGFQFYDSESEPKIFFLIEVRNVVNSRFTRDLS